MIRSTFALPAVIALMTLVGLGVALTGDGWRDVPSWFGLALPIAAVIWARVRRTSSSSSRQQAHSTKGKSVS